MINSLDSYNKLRLGCWGSLQDSHISDPTQDPLGKATDAIYRLGDVLYDPLKTIQRSDME